MFSGRERSDLGREEGSLQPLVFGQECVVVLKERGEHAYRDVIDGRYTGKVGPFCRVPRG